MQEDLEVTGISRSGRVRKKSSKLMDFESPDDIETRYRRQTPVKPFVGFRQEETEFQQQESTPSRQVEEAGTASGSESDYYDNPGENADSGEPQNCSMESDSSASDEGSTRTPANSLYMMEKSSKKKLIVKDGRVNYNERYLWKRKAKRFAMQKEQSNQPTNKIIISNPSRPLSSAGPGRPRGAARAPPAPVTPPSQAVVPVSTLCSAGMYRVTGCGAVDVAAHLRLLGESLAIIGERLKEHEWLWRLVVSVDLQPVSTAAHLRLLGESLAIIGERLKEHEGQIAVSGSVSVLLDTLLCSLAPLLSVCRALPAIAPPAPVLQDTLHNIAYIMPGL
ncbi:hypothetical protein B5X24_HaOG212741 [Helicoverpa armigera]|uniref:Uncharacterized protein n=1 Tax=Helicoverpa armigera TaxID=29058 RepID=A0A2W1B8M7_HELAM|nr:hypothetical protein B5X24_HaOG212741 [Helicoverpa armigera]